MIFLQEAEEFLILILQKKSTSFWQKKVLFFCKKKYFFLAKKKYFSSCEHMAHCKAGFDNCSWSSNLVGITSNLNKWELIPKLGIYVCTFLLHRAACKYIAFSLYFHALSAVFPDSWPLYFCKGKRIYHGHTEMYEARHIDDVQTSLNYIPELHWNYIIVYNLE